MMHLSPVYPSCLSLSSAARMAHRAICPAPIVLPGKIWYNKNSQTAPCGDTEGENDMKMFLKCCVLLLLTAACLTACTAQRVPESGVWQCEALHITLDFDTSGNTRLETDGATVFLGIVILSGRHPESGQATQLFVLECVDLTSSALTVRVSFSALPAVGKEGEAYQFFLSED